MSLLPYLTAPTILALLVGISASGMVHYLNVIVFIWFLLVIADALIRPTRRGGDRAKDVDRDRSLGWTIAVFSTFPLHVGLLIAALAAIETRSLDFQDFFLLVLTVGVARSLFGMSAAHEMLHRKSWVAFGVAQASMLSISYPHFRVEHLHCHHERIGTLDDPATARLGESFYSFYLRSISEGIVIAWNAEAVRLTRRGNPIWSMRNELLSSFALIALIYAVVGAAFGLLGICFFALQSVLGVSNIVLINYIQHYGLVRGRTAGGQRESIAPNHSWDSDHLVSNWLLFNLPRHSDHHCNGNKQYQSLDNLENAPQLPMGYLAMLWLALCPPLWRRVMDKRAQATWINRRAEAGESTLRFGCRAEI
jgi:alkane 1-monooxygenase